VRNRISQNSTQDLTGGIASPWGGGCLHQVIMGIMSRMVIVRRIMRQHGSAVVSLPKPIVRAAGLREGDYLKVRWNARRACIEMDKLNLERTAHVSST